MTTAVVGLLARGRANDRFVRLAADLQAIARVRAAQPGDEEVTAWLVLAPAAFPDDDRPAARWDGDLPHPVELRDGTRHVVVEGVDVRGRRPLLPFVRARWRERFGLPSPFIVESGPGGVRLAGRCALEDAVAPTALAVASVVVASGGQAALEAMAWAAPIVTDATTARSISAAAGETVEVGGSQAALSLSRDSIRAASFSRAGRRFVERHHDRGSTIRFLESAFGIGDDRSCATRRIDAVLDELWAPDCSEVVDRARSSVAGLLGTAV